MKRQVSCVFSDLPVLCFQANAEYTPGGLFMFRHKNYLTLSFFFLTAFVLWTAAVSCLDVCTIGPEGSAVGFGRLNGCIHQLIGTHLFLYTITDWLSLVPAVFVIGFGFLGLIQWIQRKSLRNVDHSILALGGFYLATGFMYVLFEKLIINYRPVLINGILEASYPSSTTVLVICVMSTAAIQFQRLIQNCTLRKLSVFAAAVYTLLMVIGRFLSGVHWFTDIVGGILLSAGLVALYAATVLPSPKNHKKETA